MLKEGSTPQIPDLNQTGLSSQRETHQNLTEKEKAIFLIRNYPYLFLLFNGLHSPQEDQILSEFDSIRNTKRGLTAERFLHFLFNTKDSRDIYDRIKPPSQTTPEQLLARHAGTLIRNSGMRKLLPLMWEYAFTKEDTTITRSSFVDNSLYKHTLAMLLSRLNEKDVPVLAEYLKEANHLEGHQIIMPPRDWALCKTSERYMYYSLHPKTRSVVVVNDDIVVKIMGRIAGLCLRPIVTPTGVLIPGVWYTPIQETKHEINDVYDKGNTRLQLDEAKWAIMRPVRIYSTLDPGMSPSQYLDLVKQKVSVLPTKTPSTIEGVSRVEFRQDAQEGYA